MLSFYRKEILSRIKKSKDKFIESLSFNNVKIERKDDHIYYTGKVSEEFIVRGYVDLEGSGEEVYLSKKQKIVIYKTSLSYNNQQGDYFTKQTIENLMRYRIS